MRPRRRLSVTGSGRCSPHGSRRHGGSHGRATPPTERKRGSAEGWSRAAPRRCVPGGKGREGKGREKKEAARPGHARPWLRPSTAPSCDGGRRPPAARRGGAGRPRGELSGDVPSPEPAALPCAGRYR